MSGAADVAPRCLKEAGTRSVWLCHGRDGQAIVVKTWPLGPLTLAKLAIGVSQPQRQRRGARRTAAAGIDTPAVDGPRIAVRGGRPRLELTHPFVPGDDAYELIRRSGFPDVTWATLASSCGRIVARYAAAGLLHRDLKLSNLVVDPDRARVWVIDTLGVRPTRDAAVAVARMLDRLDVQLREQGIDVGRHVRTVVIRTALRGLDRRARRAAVRRLRARPAR